MSTALRSAVAAWQRPTPRGGDLLQESLAAQNAHSTRRHHSETDDYHPCIRRSVAMSCAVPARRGRRAIGSASPRVILSKPNSLAKRSCQRAFHYGDAASQHHTGRRFDSKHLAPTHTRTADCSGLVSRRPWVSYRGESSSCSRAYLTRTWKRERGAFRRLATHLPGVFWWG